MEANFAKLPELIARTAEAAGHQDANVYDALGITVAGLAPLAA
jgi:hypothetical protein